MVREVWEIYPHSHQDPLSPIFLAPCISAWRDPSRWDLNMVPSAGESLKSYTVYFNTASTTVPTSDIDFFLARCQYFFSSYSLTNAPQVPVGCLRCRGRAGQRATVPTRRSCSRTAFQQHSCFWRKKKKKHKKNGWWKLYRLTPPLPLIFFQNNHALVPDRIVHLPWPVINMIEKITPAPVAITSL